MIRVLALVAVVACGGTSGSAPVPMSQVTPSAACTPRWLTYDRDVIDIALTPDRVVWIEMEHARIAAGPRGNEGAQVLRPPSPGWEGADGLAIAGDRLAWATEDGAVWMLSRGADPVRIGTVPKPTQVLATRDLVVVASEGGVFTLTPHGDMQQVYSDAVWVMTLEDNVVYAQSRDAIVRVALDGSPPLTLAERTPQALSILARHGRIWFTAKQQGVLEVMPSGVQLVAPLATSTMIWNLREADGRIYFTVDNVVYLIRGKAAVPVAVAHHMIGDLEVEGKTLYVTTREYAGVRTLCHDPDGPPVQLATPDPKKLACLAGETGTPNSAGELECVDPKTGDRTYSITFHHSGTVFEEYGRDGIHRGWYADGTLKYELPHRSRSGIEKHYYANGQLASEGALDETGDKHGPWKQYAPDGAARETVEWRHGKL